MALSVGSLGLRLEAGGAGPDWPRLKLASSCSSASPSRGGRGVVRAQEEAKVGPGRDRPWIGPAMAVRSNREATNDGLRTGSD